MSETLDSIFEQLINQASLQPVILQRALSVNLSIQIEADDQIWSILITEGSLILDDTTLDSPDLVFTGPEKAWQHMLGSLPEPGYQTLMATIMSGHIQVQGSMVIFNQHLMLLELMLGCIPLPATESTDSESDSESDQINSETKEPAVPELDPIIGRYLNMEFEGTLFRVYFEEAGQGTPLLCLHTAGADGRQYREILRSKAVTDHFRVVVFDLPWHGKSSPPANFMGSTYQLSTDFYVSFVMAFCRSMQLQNPVVMGCSIGGRAVLHLALRHGNNFTAAIGLQSAMHAESGNIDAYTGAAPSPLMRPDVNSQDVAAASVAAIMAPNSPAASRWETLWHYMQGGPGVFLGDLFYYFVDGDLRNGLLDQLDTEKCPIYLLTGEYDLSATPEMTLELADHINATQVQIMKDLGHFPMSENPERFLEYLVPVLTRVREESSEQ